MNKIKTTISNSTAKRTSIEGDDIITSSNAYVIVDTNIKIPRANNGGDENIEVINSEPESELTPIQVLLGENTIIQFEGGSIASSIDSPLELVGNNTTIIAPPKRIFGDTVITSGTWVMDRAYPEWFGAVAYFDPNIQNNYNDTESRNIQKIQFNYSPSTIRSSDAINKAISMKRSGEVFLQRGVYLIDSPINMSVGIQLVGTLGYNSTDEYRHPGTVIFPTDNLINGENNVSYFIGVNLNPTNNNTWEKPYIHICTQIKNLSFSTNIATPTISLLEHLPVSIKVAGNLEIDNVHWWNTPRAVKFTDDYSDLKRITNCHYDSYLIYPSAVYDSIERQYDYSSKSNIKTPTNPGNQEKSEVSIENANLQIIAFDLGSLGDGLLFQHNAVSNQFGGITSLKIQSCGGAEISANIINADIDIFSSQGIVFEGNHMEYGVRMWVENSTVNINGNFIEKYNSRPSFVFKGSNYYGMSNIILQNNYLHSRGVLNHAIDDDTDMQALINQVKDICDYDILITQNVNLNITDTYRYYSNHHGYGTNPLGLKIKKYIEPYGTTNPLQVNSNFDYNSVPDFSEFNDYSSHLSHGCKISRLKILDRFISFDKLNLCTIANFQQSDEIYWLDGEYQEYFYAYQIIFDRDRHIVSPIKLISENTQRDNRPLSSHHGVLIVTNGDSNLNVLIRLYKVRGIPENRIIDFFSGRISNVRNEFPDVEPDEDFSEPRYAKYVDIPLCGARFLYDNDYSVSGFKWNSWSPSDVLAIGNTNACSIKFIGDNVICNSESDSISGQWKAGDQINDISTGTSRILTTCETGDNVCESCEQCS